MFAYNVLPISIRQIPIFARSQQKQLSRKRSSLDPGDNLAFAGLRWLLLSNSDIFLARNGDTKAGLYKGRKLIKHD